jgi:hypothetical protein
METSLREILDDSYPAVRRLAETIVDRAHQHTEDFSAMQYQYTDALSDYVANQEAMEIPIFCEAIQEMQGAEEAHDILEETLQAKSPEEIEELQHKTEVLLNDSIKSYSSKISLHNQYLTRKSSLQKSIQHELNMAQLCSAGFLHLDIDELLYNPKAFEQHYRQTCQESPFVDQEKIDTHIQKAAELAHKFHENERTIASLAHDIDIVRNKIERYKQHYKTLLDRQHQVCPNFSSKLHYAFQLAASHNSLEQSHVSQELIDILSERLQLLCTELVNEIAQAEYIQDKIIIQLFGKTHKPVAANILANNQKLQTILKNIGKPNWQPRNTLEQLYTLKRSCDGLLSILILMNQYGFDYSHLDRKAYPIVLNGIKSLVQITNSCIYELTKKGTYSASQYIAIDSKPAWLSKCDEEQAWQLYKQCRNFIIKHYHPKMSLEKIVRTTLEENKPENLQAELLPLWISYTDLDATHKALLRKIVLVDNLETYLKTKLHCRWIDMFHWLNDADHEECKALLLEAQDIKRCLVNMLIPVESQRNPTIESIQRDYNDIAQELSENVAREQRAIRENRGDFDKFMSFLFSACLQQFGALGSSYDFAGTWKILAGNRKITLKAPKGEEDFNRHMAKLSANVERANLEMAQSSTEGAPAVTIQPSTQKDQQEAPSPSTPGQGTTATSSDSALMLASEIDMTSMPLDQAVDMVGTSASGSCAAMQRTSDEQRTDTYKTIVGRAAQILANQTEATPQQQGQNALAQAYEPLKPFIAEAERGEAPDKQLLLSDAIITIDTLHDAAQKASQDGNTEQAGIFAAMRDTIGSAYAIMLNRPRVGCIDRAIIGGAIGAAEGMVDFAEYTTSLIKNPEKAFHDLGLAATKYVIFVGNLCTDRQAWQQVGDALKEFLQLPAEERTRIVMRCCSSLKIAPKLAHTALEFGCQKGLSLIQKRQLLARLDRLGKQASKEISKFIKDIQREAARVGKKPQAQTLEGIEIPVPNAEGLTTFMEGEEVAHEAAKLCPAEEVKPVTDAAETVKPAAQGVQAVEEAEALADKAGAEGRAVQEMQEGVQAAEKTPQIAEQGKSPAAEGVQERNPLDKRNMTSEQLEAEAARKARGQAIRDNGRLFEEQLQERFGGTGSFKVDGREFDGAFENIWYEAKSGQYWDVLTSSTAKLEDFKSAMGQRLNIAKQHGAQLKLFSNSPIPQFIKDWLTKKGIEFLEIL